MTSEQLLATGPAAREAVRDALVRFLEERLKTTVTADQDLFACGLVNSMFAMELVVTIEQLFGVAIVGPDLQLVNFRSVDAMTDLVLRLQSADGA
ncbi:phosphopantetheine attachment site family protein [Rhodococcus sp. MTM3W5.2]|uniref:acyl carrier protein n=1 Tax=Rhodococcus sp. MTM3W5.2 TaxID=1805827 RepID=UPI00097925FB|nr:acyl carrier protein [Rhodococcus sp. MTM3W5.2]AQA25113.1 phosphopantetheine attachment site family protein [Rhodococcus sp. MTM3W5.2]